MSGSSRSSTPLHKTLYALPAFVLAFPTIPVFVLLPTFYGETVGLGLATVGAILFGLRILDVISDPLLGWLSDRLPMKWHKRKLPIFTGALVTGAALYFLFTPSPDSGPAYLITWGGALYLGWTAIQIPYQAWAAELEPDYRQRTQLNALREGATLLGLLATGAAGVLLAQMDVFERYELMAIITLVAGVIVFVPCLVFVPRGQQQDTPTGFNFPYKNKLFLRLLSAWFVNGLANGLPAVCLPLFVTHILSGSDEDRASLLFIYFLFAIIGIPFWVYLGNHVSKHRVWCLSLLTACAVFIFVPFLGAGQITAFMVICALSGLCLGADLALPPSLQADCADWDRCRFGHNRLGSLYAYWSMSSKLALGAAVGLAFPLLEVAGLETGTDLSKITLIVIYAALPVVLKLIAARLMWHFPLTQNKHRAIKRALERKA